MLGFSLLLAIRLIGFALGLVIPTERIGLLGLLPILIRILNLLDSLKSKVSLAAVNFQSDQTFGHSNNPPQQSQSQRVQSYAAARIQQRRFQHPSPYLVVSKPVAALAQRQRGFVLRRTSMLNLLRSIRLILSGCCSHPISLECRELQLCSPAMLALLSHLC